MRVRCAGLIVLLALLASAESKWIRMESPNFQIYCSDGERGARETLKQFEQVRAFFLSSMKVARPTPLPVRIVAFGSRKEFEAVRPMQFAAAFYQSGMEYDTIVLSDTGAETFPIAVHEYFHLWAKHSGVKLPIWLNEGFAEVYSSIRMQGDKVVIGSLLPGRLQALRTEKWIPMSTVLTVEHGSPYYQEKEKAGSFYNQSWALAHMLMLEPDYGQKFDALLGRLAGGMPSAEALSQTYGRPVAVIEKDLQGYIRGDRFTGGLVPTKLIKLKAELPAEPAKSFEVDLLLADLKNRPGRETETRTLLENLSARQPDRPEPFVALGYLSWRSGSSAEARDYFAKAFALGSRNPRMLWDYGRLAMEESPDASAAALTKLVEMEPNRVETRVDLGMALLRAGKPDQGLTFLLPVKQVTRDEAPSFLRVLAFTHLKLGNTAAALTAARQWSTVAREGLDTGEAQRLLTYLTQAAEQAKVPAPVPYSAKVVEGGEVEEVREAEPTGPPAVQRAQPKPRAEEAILRPGASYVEGRFVHLDCSGQKLVFVVESEGKSYRLTIEDPTDIILLGKVDGPLDLRCGSQLPAPVKVGYDAPESGKARLRSIEYLPVEP